MTCREFMKNNYLHMISPLAKGGVKGCPNTYIPRTEPLCGGMKSKLDCTDEICTKCWEQEIPKNERNT